MEHRTEELGLRPPDTADETTSETAEDSARATGDAEWRPATGHPRVDAALARLGELEGLPVTEHRAVFEDVHRRLRDVLGELDTGQPLEAGHAAGTTSRPGR
jgi:hypothetical protein